MEFEQACSEMDYILQHMRQSDLNKIPIEVIKFFKENKDIFYKVEIDGTKKLYEQELKNETKAFIKILNAKYFGGEKEKQELNNIINSKEETHELQNIKNEMIMYKENKNMFVRIFDKILKFLKITKE